VNSLVPATERLFGQTAYLKDLPAGLRMSRLYAALLGRKDLPKRSEFAQLRRGLQLMIIGLAGWVGLVVAATIVAVLSVEASIVSAPAGLGTRASAAGAVDAGSRAGFENISQRPLFSRSRTPVAVVLPVALPAPPPPLRDRDIKLKGVFIDGTITKAFLTSTESPFGSWVGLNGEIGGWRVEAVTPDQVVLNASDEKLIIPLTFGGASHAGVSASKDVHPPRPIFGPRQNPNQILVPPRAMPPGR